MNRFLLFLACAAPFFVILAPFLFGTQIFAAHDTRFYPYFEFYQNAIRNGESILWNPHNYSGFPIFTSITGGFLSPLLYLFLRYAPSIFAYNWLIFFGVAFGAFFAALFLRKIGISFWPSVIGGVVFVFSQWKWIDDLGITNAIALLPLFFLLLLMIHRRERYAPLWFVLSVVYGILSANFHYFVEALFAAFLFAIFLLGFDENNKTFSFRRAGERKRAIIWFMSGTLIAILITLYQIVPTFVYTQISSGRAAIPHWEAVQDGIHLGDLPKLLLPYFDIWFVPSSLDASYIGVLPLLFLVYAFFLKKPPIIKFFLILFCASILLALNNSWLFWILHHVPPFSLLHLSFRWMFVAWFGAAALVGWGMEQLARGEWNASVATISRLLKTVALAILGISAVFSAGIYFFQDNLLGLMKAYFANRLYSGTNNFPLEHYYQYIEKIFSDLKALLYIFEPRFLLPLVSIFIALVAWRGVARASEERRFFRWIYIFVALNFLTVWIWHDIGLSASVFAKEPATASFLKQYGKEGRVLTFLKGATEFEKLFVPSRGRAVSLEDRFILNSEMFFANTNMLYGIDSAEIYEPLMSGRMARLISLLGSELVWAGDKLARAPGTPEEKARVLASRGNILNFLNIRYIASAYPLDQTRFKKIFETKIIPPYDIPIAIYENEYARPLFYFASSVQEMPEGEDFAFEAAKNIPENDFGVFVECGDALACGGKDSLGMANDKVVITVEVKKNAYASLRTESKSDGLLVFSENNLPGWKAYVDGTEQQILTVGSVYIGIIVPAGKHQVTFRFTYKGIIDSFI